MPTNSGWDRERRAADGETPPPAARSGVRRLGAERWRLTLQEFLDVCETCIVSTGVVAVLAAATLLLIRTLAS
jgi:hypothetical protein